MAIFAKVEAALKISMEAQVMANVCGIGQKFIGDGEQL
jgi:hypothetical protein